MKKIILTFTTILFVTLSFSQTVISSMRYPHLSITCSPRIGSIKVPSEKSQEYENLLLELEQTYIVSFVSDYMAINTKELNQKYVDFTSFINWWGNSSDYIFTNGCTLHKQIIIDNLLYIEVNEINAKFLINYNNVGKYVDGLYRLYKNNRDFSGFGCR